MLTLLLAGFAFACPSTRASVDESVAEATARYLALDLTGFDTASAEALAQAACLVEPASPPTVAGIHRVRALRAWVDRDAPGMIAAFAALRAAAPDQPVDEHLAPPGSQLHEVYIAVPPESASRMAPLPGSGWVVDGRAEALLVPLDRATLVQRAGIGGSIEQSWYFPLGARLDPLFPASLVSDPLVSDPLSPGAPFPGPPGPTSLPEAVATAAGLTRTPRPSRTLAVGSGAALLVGSAALVAASVTRAEYLASGPDAGAREDLYTLNVAAGTAGFTGCAAAAGLFLGAVLVGRW
ncbi:MAG: hypothetical protein Q8P18_13120 [Pseudomonadota bacterium]|nr:hypothetical protein [Pseudomonadota bacterium]